VFGKDTGSAWTSQHNKSRVSIWRLATRPRARIIYDSHCSIARRPGGYMYHRENGTVQYLFQHHVPRVSFYAAC
jgi:hypothetical protein